MNMREQIEEAEVNILHTYNRFPVVFERGEGCYLYDTEGKKYLDCAAGIAVNALGYHYPGYDEALKAQIDKLIHISNLSNDYVKHPSEVLKVGEIIECTVIDINKEKGKVGLSLKNV